MNSSQLSKVFIFSAIFAVVAYVLTTTAFEPSAVITAVIVFISAFVTAAATSGSGDATSAPSEIKTLYVGNLPYRANEAAIRELFSKYGYVQSVRLMKDKHTGKRRGFGFVEISAKDADNAIASLNDNEFQQRTLKVREAKERPEKTEDSE